MVKQVIVMRTDLKNKKGKPVNLGKCVAQGGHAVLNTFVDRLVKTEEADKYELKLNKEEIEWLNDELRTKICLGVESDEELLDIYNKAKEANLNVCLVTDAGLTEFKEPTRTCLAIGPDDSEKINKITGHLKLLAKLQD